MTSSSQIKDGRFDTLQALQVFTLPVYDDIDTVEVPEEGALAYDCDSKTVQLSDGTSWKGISSGGMIIPNCIFNNTSDTQVCALDSDLIEFQLANNEKGKYTDRRSWVTGDASASGFYSRTHGHEQPGGNVRANDESLLIAGFADCGDIESFGTVEGSLAMGYVISNAEDSILRVTGRGAFNTSYVESDDVTATSVCANGFLVGYLNSTNMITGSLNFSSTDEGLTFGYNFGGDMRNNESSSILTGRCLLDGEIKSGDNADYVSLAFGNIESSNGSTTDVSRAIITGVSSINGGSASGSGKIGEIANNAEMFSCICFGKAHSEQTAGDITNFTGIGGEDSITNNILFGYVDSDKTSGERAGINGHHNQGCVIFGYIDDTGTTSRSIIGNITTNIAGNRSNLIGGSSQTSGSGVSNIICGDSTDEVRGCFNFSSINGNNVTVECTANGTDCDSGFCRVYTESFDVECDGIGNFISGYAKTGVIDTNSAEPSAAHAFGDFHMIQNDSAVCIGSGAKTNFATSFNQSAGADFTHGTPLLERGNAQCTTVILKTSTSGATTSTMTLATIEDSYTFNIMVVARGISGGTDVDAAYKLNGIIVSSSSMPASSQTVIYESHGGLNATVAASSGLEITVTSIGGSVRWVACVELTVVKFDR